MTEPCITREPDDPAIAVYPVRCGCGWFGMREDCSHGACPNCGGRVRREKEE